MGAGHVDMGMGLVKVNTSKDLTFCNWSINWSISMLGEML
jgi:hypothetical protein